MTALYIILGIVGFIMFCICMHVKNKTARLKKWKKGDLIALYENSEEFRTLQNSRKTMATLIGWSYDHVYLDLGTGSTYKLSHNEIRFNKSYLWRENHEKAAKFMGEEPGFSPGLGPDIVINKEENDFLDGKTIDLLLEVECEVYLKKAVKEQNFEMAAKLRQRLEHYR